MSNGITGEIPNGDYPAGSIDRRSEYVDEPMDAVFEVDEIEVKRNEKKNNAVYYIFRFKVIEPVEFLDDTHREAFFIGTPEDPDHKDPATWNKYPGQMMHEMFTAMKIPMSGGLSKMFASAIGARVGVQLRWEKKVQPGYQPRIQAKAYKPLIDSKGSTFKPKLVVQEKPVAPPAPATGPGTASAGPAGSYPSTGAVPPPPKPPGA